MLSTPILFILFLGAFLSLALFRFYHLKRKEKAKSLQGLATLTLLIDIIKLTQQHRGLQSGLLNGQSQVLNDLIKQEQSLNSQYQMLMNDKMMGDKVSRRLISKAYTQWQNVLNKPSPDINRNFHQHSRLIQRLLDCLWDLADEYSLTSHRDKQIQILSNDLVRTLPELTEAIGQVRAITLQITNTKYCSADKKLQLLFTLGKIKRDLTQIEHKLDQNRYLKLLSFIKEVTQSVEDHALGNRNPEAFFAEASLHMEVIFNEIRAGFEDLQGKISNAS